MSYRYDIEGLRAIAVLLVVIFHINETLIPGGFIGVDLFFVISGYVITQRIYKDGLNSIADFAEFYRRRIRRIMPAMLFVTAITFIVGSFILLPEDLVDLSWSAIFASISAANVYFTYFLDTSYFAKDSHYVPLLHLWSLGVEEQFYLIWPLLLFVLLKFPKAILPTLIAIMVGSVAWGEYLLRTGSYSAAYYMLPSRAFQLCAGGFCLFLAQSRFIRRLPSSILLMFGVGGVVLVTGSAYALTGADTFPGLNAVPVTLGGALLLLAGTKQTVLSRALSIRPARFVGGISYSMYLWHWPILAFLRYLYVDIDATVGTGIFVGIVVLAYLSSRFIEEPFRHSSTSFGRVFAQMFAVPTMAICAIAYLAIHMGGFLPIASPANYASDLERLRDETKAAHRYPYVCQRVTVHPDDTTKASCVINGASEPRALLWGDSNAAHYIGILSELAKNENASFRNIEHASCPPILNDGDKFAPRRSQDACKQSLKAVIPMLDRYDHIILAALFGGYARNPEFLPELKQTIKSLVSHGKKVTVIGQAMGFSRYDRFCRQKSLKINIDCEEIFTTDDVIVNTINRELKDMASHIPKLSYVDFNSLICPSGMCSPYYKGQPIYYDNGHISMAGSHALGTEAVASGKYDGIFSKGGPREIRAMADN